MYASANIYQRNGIFMNPFPFVCIFYLPRTHPSAVSPACTTTCPHGIDGVGGGASFVSAPLLGTAHPSKSTAFPAFGDVLAARARMRYQCAGRCPDGIPPPQWLRFF